MNKQLVYLPIGDIKPYENNPRHNESAIEAVAKSIQEFGFKNPIILDKHNVIIAGHTRLKAAEKLGLKEVPCIIADDLTDKQAKAFRLADNKVGELAEWDFVKLSAEIEGLPAFSAEEFGFDMREIDAALNKGKEAVEDDYEEPDYIEPRIKRGEVWQLGNHRLMCGDSCDADDIALLMGGDKADMILTDPPYNVDYEGATGMKIQNDKQKDSDFLTFLLKAFTNMADQLKAGGVVYCFHADTEGLNFRTAFKGAGLKLSECLVWVKNSLVLGRQDYHWRHEPILYGWKEGAAHIWLSDRKQSTVLEFDRPTASLEHPTMKPIALCSYLMNNSSAIGEKILDVFGGSGTTLICAEQLDRKCYMMELDEHYANVIIDRWETYTGKNAEKIC